MVPSGHKYWLFATSLAAALQVAAAFTTQSERSSTHELRGDTVVIDSTRMCAECRIEARHLVTLGGAADSIAVYGFPSTVRSKARKLFYLITNPPTQLAVYDSTGMLQSLLGRSGRGPGEFVSISRLDFGPADSLVVVDGFGRRMSVFDPSNGFARSFPVTMAWMTGSETLWLSDGTFLVGGTRITPGLMGYPLHHLSAAGTILSSFGAYPREDDRLARNGTPRKTAARNDTVWAVPSDRYAIDIMSLEGKHLRTIVRDAPWFPERSRVVDERVWGTYTPEPLVTDIGLDEEGLLWVVLVLGRPEWVPGHRVDYVSGERRDWYRTLIEVLDPQSGRLVARTFMDEFCHGFTEPGLVYTHREDDQGDVVYDIWQVRLHGLDRAHWQREP